MSRTPARAGSPDPEDPDAVRDHHCRRASSQLLPLQRSGLCGCIFVVPDGVATGPMHARASAASGGIERPAFLSGSGPAVGHAPALRAENPATMRNRTHRVAADLEAAAPPEPEPAHDRPAEIMMAIDGAHIRAAHGYQSGASTSRSARLRSGQPPRRFALAPKGASGLWRHCAKRCGNKDGGLAEP